jgi:hypothetical protein
VTDAPSSPEPTPAPAFGQGQEIEVDLAAFLPDGAELADESDDLTAVEADVVEVDVVEVDLVEVIEDPEGNVTVVEVDVVEVVAAADAPAVDLEALTQIERDLDAVDAAIAALDAGTYGIDPATGQPIDDVLLAADPTRLS